MKTTSNFDLAKYDNAMLEIRTEINLLDEKIVQLLLKRYQLVVQAEEIKHIDELPHLSVEREQVIMENVCFGLLGQQKEYVKEIYGQILGSSRDLEK